MDATHVRRSPRVWEHAVETLGSEERAEMWMETRLAELGNRTPEEVLSQDPESKEVDAILGRIDYGVFG
jgi:putative toxin-antitoxin system antitoxin component (TIGR02293 family)